MPPKKTTQSPQQKAKAAAKAFKKAEAEKAKVKEAEEVKLQKHIRREMKTEALADQTVDSTADKILQEQIDEIVAESLQELLDKKDNEDASEDAGKTGNNNLGKTGIFMGAAASQLFPENTSAKRTLNTFNLGQRIASVLGISIILANKETIKKLGKMAAKMLSSDQLLKPIKEIVEMLQEEKDGWEELKSKFQPPQHTVTTTSFEPLTHIDINTSSSTSETLPTPQTPQTRAEQLQNNVTAIIDSERFPGSHTEDVKQRVKTAKQIDSALQRKTAGTKVSSRIVKKKTTSLGLDYDIEKIFKELDQLRNRLPENYDDGIFENKENKDNNKDNKENNKENKENKDNNEDNKENKEEMAVEIEVRDAIQTIGQRLADQIEQFKLSYPDTPLPDELINSVKKLISNLSTNTLDRLSDFTFDLLSHAVALSNPTTAIVPFLRKLIIGVTSKGFKDIVKLVNKHKKDIANSIINNAVQHIPSDAIGKAVNKTTDVALAGMAHIHNIAHNLLNPVVEPPVVEPPLVRYIDDNLPLPRILPQPRIPLPRIYVNSPEIPAIPENPDEENPDEENPEEEEENPEDNNQNNIDYNRIFDDIKKGGAVGAAALAVLVELYKRNPPVLAIGGIANNQNTYLNSENSENSESYGDLRPEFISPSVNIFSAQKNQLQNDASNWINFNFVSDPLNEGNNNQLANDNKINDDIRMSGPLFLPSLEKEKPMQLSLNLKFEDMFYDVIQLNQGFNDVFETNRVPDLLSEFDRTWIL